MAARLSAFVIWALITASAVFWVLRLVVHSAPVPVHSVAIGDIGSGRGDLTRLLGAPPVDAIAVAAAPEASSRFHLLGIMAPKAAGDGEAGRGGLALIAVDGKPPRPFEVGSHLDADLVLQSVSMRTASIGPAQGAHTVVLEIPRLPEAATGKLPASGTASPVPVAPAVVPRPLAAPPVPRVAPAAGLPRGTVRPGSALAQ